ncbi:MAG: trehalose/maltose transport system permease protein [Candidatus Tokpelaia sp. JSC161]|jgi:trehalose/maltose transport system permease protein|nr:MAG: trehalose/maltose transport system permease protein [Candidatus Tokpelaia sp. JSC161]
MMKQTFKNTAFYIFVAVLILFSVFPFYYAIITSFTHGGALFQVQYWPKHFDFINYKTIFSQDNFLLSLVNSLIVATITVICSLFLGITAAYALGRVTFYGRTLLLLSILAISMFPQVAILAGLFELIRFFALFNTRWALILSYTILSLPFTVWVLTIFMRSLPVEIEEAAIIDGATPWIIITHIFWPLLRPAVITTGLLSFIGAWNEFLFALTFIRSESLRTVPMAIAFISGASEHEIPWGIIMAASVVVTVPLIILVLFFQRRIIEGLVLGGVKG